MINTTINNYTLTFETNDHVFSPRYIDRGTLALLSKVNFSDKDKVLDLGCGYGVVGILAAKSIGEQNVVLCDISPEAINLAKMNAEMNHLNLLDIRYSDLYSTIPENDFTLILSNPPYHTDFSVAKKIIETGYHKLVYGGRLIMVTKRLDWYKNKLISTFGGVQYFEIDGYYVFISEKRKRSTYKEKKDSTQKLSKKLQRKCTKHH